jgi:protein SCO1/2
VTRSRPPVGLTARLILGLTVTLATTVVSDRGSCALAQQSLQGSSGVSLNDGVPRQVRDVTVEQKLGEQLPLDLPLVDSEGRAVDSGYYIDGNKPTIVTLNYSDCPMLCNVQLNQLASSLSKLDLQIGEDFQILTVSIDPKESTATAQKTKEKYVGQLEKQQPNASDGWAFCTADQTTITELADVLGFRYTYDQASGEYYHPAMLVFASPQGVISRYSLEVAFEPADLRKALIEAGEGTVGTPVDQLILWCFSFDPSSNSYVPQAWKIMRAGGAATVLLIVVCMAPYWIGRKRGPNKEPTDSPTTEDHSSDLESV